MTSTLTYESELDITRVGLPDEGHQFFDPRSPEQPDEILGVETKAILRLGRAVTDLGALPPSANLGLYALPNAVRLVPLVEDMQAGVEMTPEAIRPYRKSIKKLSLGVSVADKLAVGAGAIGIGIPLRRALNRRIEREFPIRAAQAMETAREAIASIETDVQHISKFDNPKQQFVDEVGELADTVVTAINRQRDDRIRHNTTQTPEPEFPKGVAGFFAKVVHKVRGFFGGFRRKSQVVNHDVTAYDAGAGIKESLTSLMNQPDPTAKRLPLVSKLLIERIPRQVAVSKDRLSLVAPEVLNFLFSMFPDDQKKQELLYSVERNPHEFRFVTAFKKTYGRYYLDGIQAASRTLLPAIRDILPTEGSKIRDTFSRMQELLKAKPPVDEKPK